MGIQNILNNLEDLTNDEMKYLFRIVSDEMKKQVIGYIKIDDKFEPAISERESFSPLSSFGISNVHISDCFIPFPKNKTLYDMCKDPLNFANWCEKNLK